MKLSWAGGAAFLCTNDVVSAVVSAMKETRNLRLAPPFWSHGAKCLGVVYVLVMGHSRVVALGGHEIVLGGGAAFLCTDDVVTSSPLRVPLGPCGQ